MDGSSRSTQSGGPTTQSGLACNICFRRILNSPVAAYCGHVFCWPCLYRSWPQQGPGLQSGPAITRSCPVCGTALREGYNIVPIYGFDNVASPTSGPERPTTTGTTTAAAAAAPDNATSSRPAAPVSSTPIPPRPTVAAFFTAAPRHPHSAAARAAARAALDTVTSSRPTAVSSDTDIPPRPNPPARITQTQTQTQTDAGGTALVRPLGPNRLRSLRNLASTPRHGFLNNLFLSGAGNRLRPASSAARDIGSGVASRSVRRRRNLWLNHLRLMNPRGMDDNGGNSIESLRVRRDVLRAILDAIGAIRAEMDALRDAREELEDDLI